MASKMLYPRSRFKSKRFQMSGRSKLFILIPAILLIPILLGMTPLNFVQKIGAGCPLSQGKQEVKCNPCPFHSIASHDNQILASLSLATVFQVLPSTQELGISLLYSFYSNTFLNPVPLRC